MQAFVLFIGRLLLSIIFIYSAVSQVNNWDNLTEIMTAKQIPMIPVFLVLSLVLQLFGALALIFGNKSRLGAVLLILFIIPTTIVFHDWWNLAGQDQEIEMITFMRNMAILGGLFYILVFGSGHNAYEEYYDEEDEFEDFDDDEDF